MRSALSFGLATSLFTGLFAAFGLVSGCAVRSQDLVVPGRTTVMELKASQGEPGGVNVPESRPQAKLLCYREGCCYQVERSVVMTTACEPTEEERSLQYWRHKWKGDPQRYEPVPLSSGVHGAPVFQLVSEKARTAVIYDPHGDRVVRVVHYGPR